jgi:TfuA protein
MTVMIAPPVIFSGPSLSSAEVAGLLKIEADLRPPVRNGDLESLPEGVRTVAMIDGVFYSELAVSVRETLNVIKRGIRVLGSSSMGALRAAELDFHGMIGIGEVYQMYARGEIDSDAEVALTFHPETFAATSEPLVNVRYGIKQAISAGVIDTKTGGLILEVARDIYFPHRIYPALFKKAAGVVSTQELRRYREYVLEHGDSLNLKRLDAIRLIGILNNGG